MNIIIDWLMMPGIQNKIQYALETTFPAPDYLRKVYHFSENTPWPMLYIRRFWEGWRYSH